jgi:hypothetical protein
VANPLRSITIHETIAQIETQPGAELPRYAMPLDRARVYEWIPEDTDTADSVKVLDHSGGHTGTWHEVRVPDKGADLGDASVSLTVAGEVWRTLPAATLTDNRTLTLSTTNAEEGDTLGVTRLDAGAFTVAFVNGGAGAGTLCTMPVSARAYALFYYDGTNWSARASALML